MRKLILITAICALTACSGSDNNANGTPNNGSNNAENNENNGGDAGPNNVNNGGDAGPNNENNGADMGGGDDAGDNNGNEVTLPTWDELEDGWNDIYPGGDTACALGQDWNFYVYKGDPTKVTVHYFGGGGCWNEATCSGDVYTDDLTSLREQIDAGDRSGIFDMENAENPVGDWTHIVVPYCTGDVHWGDNIVEYGVGNVIHHKGGVNAQTVIDFAERELPDAEDVFVQGCSAGAYGAIMWAPHFMNMYPNATHTVFADSGAGVITDDFFTNSFPNWNAEGVFPSFIDALDPAQIDIFALTMIDLYGAIGEAYPNAMLSQWNTELDETQTLFYTLMGGMGDQMGWSMRMYELTHGIVANTPNYRNWTAGGQSHCILPFNGFYTHETNGVRLVDWLGNMLERNEVDNVACEDCQLPPE